MRQWSEENKYRSVVELYCHQFAYGAQLPTQCEPILVEGTQQPYQYYWPVGSRAEVPTFWDKHTIVFPHTDKQNVLTIDWPWETDLTKISVWKLFSKSDRPCFTWLRILLSSWFTFPSTIWSSLKIGRHPFSESEKWMSSFSRQQKEKSFSDC